MKNKELIYISLNLLASIFYIIAFIKKDMTFLGIGGCLLIINSLFGLFKVNKKKNNI